MKQHVLRRLWRVLGRLWRVQSVWKPNYYPFQKGNVLQNIILNPGNCFIPKQSPFLKEWICTLTIVAGNNFPGVFLFRWIGLDLWGFVLKTLSRRCCEKLIGDHVKPLKYHGNTIGERFASGSNSVGFVILVGAGDLKAGPDEIECSISEQK